MFIRFLLTISVSFLLFVFGGLMASIALFLITEK